MKYDKKWFTNGFRCYGGGGSYGGTSGDSTSETNAKGRTAGSFTDVGWLRDLIQTGGANNGPMQQAINWAKRPISYDTTLPGYTNSIQVANTLKPLDASYRTNTENLFDHNLERGMAVARSGPDAVLAPLNRGKSFREAEVINQGARDREDVVRKWRESDANILDTQTSHLTGDNAYKAASLLHQYFMNMGSSAPGIANALSPRVEDTENTNKGKGSQNSTAFSYGAGINLCCFIFLESYNGKLPWWVRVCRDAFVTDHRRRGYVWMSNWLVPLMRKYKLIRWLVNVVMVRPLTQWGSWACRVSDKGQNLQWIVKMWFRIWDTIGKVV